MRSLVTLTERRDFLSAARAKRAPSAAFMLQARRRAENEHESGKIAPEQIRIGFTCSKKVGNAVARNRAKRRLRAIARDILPAHGQPGWDYVLIGRAQKTASREFAQMKTDLLQAISQIHKPRTQK